MQLYNQVLKSPLLHIVGLVALLILGLFLSITTGSFDFGLGEILEAMTNAEASGRLVIWELRLPRALVAALAGAILSLAGFYMQVLVRNPLADPYIMGLTAGAGFGVNLSILGLVPLGLGVFGKPFMAGIGALMSLLLLFGLGFRSLRQDSHKLLIAGVAVSAMLTALTSFLIYRFAEDNHVREIVFWTFGSLQYASWKGLGLIAVMMVTSLGFGLITARKMDLLMLGEDTAQSLGLRTSRFKLALLLVASISVGTVVAFTGPIGFVGMMIPHACRSLFGLHHRPNMVYAALLGAAFLPLCDAFSRIIYPPAGLPIGIITALLGVPFFLYILFSGKKFWA